MTVQVEVENRSGHAVDAGAARAAVAATLRAEGVTAGEVGVVVVPVLEPCFDDSRLGRKLLVGDLRSQALVQLRPRGESALDEIRGHRQEPQMVPRAGRLVAKEALDVWPDIGIRQVRCATCEDQRAGEQVLQDAGRPVGSLDAVQAVRLAQPRRQMSPGRTVGIGLGLGQARSEDFDVLDQPPQQGLPAAVRPS